MSPIGFSNKKLLAEYFNPQIIVAQAVEAT